MQASLNPRLKTVFFLSNPVEFPCQPSLPTPISLSVIPTKLASLVLPTLGTRFDSGFREVELSQIHDRQVHMQYSACAHNTAIHRESRIAKK